jgi:V-type H+-transporting ATPase subunit C
MPSDLSYWLISAPLKDGDPNVMLEEVQKELPGVVVGGWQIPELKVGPV